MKGIRYIALIGVCLLGNTLGAQDIRQELKQVRKAYAAMPDMSMEIVIRLYANHRITQPIETEQGTYFKKGRNIYSELLGTTSLQNEKYLIHVSEENKYMTVDRPAALDGNGLTIMPIDSIVDYASEVKHIRLKNKHLYTFYYNDNKHFNYSFERIELLIDQQTHLIDKLVFYYRFPMNFDINDPTAKGEKPRMEMYYTNVRKAPDFPSGLFAHSKFISEMNGTLLCSTAYSEFRLINHLKSPWLNE